MAEPGCRESIPGSAWTDPELLKTDQRLTQFPPQGYRDATTTGLVLIAAWLPRPVSEIKNRCSGQMRMKRTTASVDGYLR